VKLRTRELNERSEQIKIRLRRQTLNLDREIHSLLEAFLGLRTNPLAAIGQILGLALSEVPTRASLPIWLKIAAIVVRESRARN
jgi:hypothetical protein